MRKLMVLLAFLPALSMAQDIKMPAGMQGLDMQQMMGLAEEMQACFATVDQQALEALGREAQAKGEEIKALCDAGKLVEARSTAIAFAREVMANPEMQKLQNCSEKVREQIPVVAWGDVGEADESGTDICELGL